MAKRGGKRDGAGKPPKWGEKVGAMIPLCVRVPQIVKDKLIARFGSAQKAIDELIIRPILNE